MPSANSNTVSEISNANREVYIGVFEVYSLKNPEKSSIWEVVRNGNQVKVGTACNTGFLPIYSMEIEDFESVDEALQEAYSDLQVEIDDGAKYMSRLK